MPKLTVSGFGPERVTVYFMRGYYALGPYYVYWQSVGTPDLTGASSPFPGFVTDILIQTVTAK